MTPRLAAAVLAATAAVLAGCSIDPTATASPPPSQPPSGTEGPFYVQYVTDGDTIGVRTGIGVVRVRLIGVDTPETKKPGTAVQCWGPQATTATRDLVLHQNVWLERDPVAGRSDTYGRELAYVWRGNRLINHELIADGAGRQYAYQNQRYRYRDSFEAVEATARGKDLGLWGHCP